MNIIRIFIITACMLFSFSAQDAAASLTCRTGGCNGEICESVLSGGMASICVVREEYICYRTAKCERQKNGECGWTMTKELEQCLKEKTQPIYPTDIK